MMESFKDKHPFEKRRIEATNIRTKYPGRVPIIVEKTIDSDIVSIDKNKFLAPIDITMGQFVYIIRKRINMPPEKSLFVFIKNHIPAQHSLLSAIYDEYADKDGFLYINYAGENTFGE